MGLLPPRYLPSKAIELICAGQSAPGWNSPPNMPTTTSASARASTPTALAASVARTIAVGEQHGRRLTKWEFYKAGADTEALSWLTDQAGADTRSGGDTNVRQLADPISAVNLNMGTLVGSYASVARMLDELATVPGLAGVLVTFDDFVAGVEAFGFHIQPRMQCRAANTF